MEKSRKDTQLEGYWLILTKRWGEGEREKEGRDQGSQQKAYSFITAWLWNHSSMLKILYPLVGSSFLNDDLLPTSDHNQLPFHTEHSKVHVVKSSLPPLLDVVRRRGRVKQKCSVRNKNPWPEYIVRGRTMTLSSSQTILKKENKWIQHLTRFLHVQKQGKAF